MPVYLSVARCARKPAALPGVGVPPRLTDPMSTHETLAARFARCVTLFREPGAREDQKAEFRALLGLLKDAAVSLRAAGGRLEINGIPCEGQSLAVLVQRLDLHGIGEIELPAEPPPSPPPPSPPPQPPARGAAPPGDPTPGAKTAAPKSPAPAGSLPLPAGAADVVAQLTREPTAPAAGDLLAALVHHAELALKQRRPDQLLGVIGAIVAVEESVPEASGMRRQYAIALRRVYTKTALNAMVRLLSEPKYRADAVVALRRGGAGAVEVLMDLLVAAPTMDERRSAFDALRHMTEGTEQLVHALEHREWFVVRNVAELIGELGIESAVPALARQLEHADERVRKAVALALAKIGTRARAEPLRRALHDASPEVRMQVALGIGGQKSAALAMPLVVAMDEEKDEAVLRELILALGRIASPDAVQALIKCSQPAGRIFGRKAASLRLAAVEGLRLAATPAARGTLEGLAEDGDKQVRAAARAAASELGRKRGR